MGSVIKKIVVCSFIIFLCASCSNNHPSPTSETAPAYDYSQKLQVGKEVLFVEIVSDAKKMQDGLSNRDSLAENNGMLFDFGTKKTTPTFWMKDMKFNLDLIWIDENKIVGITPEVPAPNKKSENLPLYSPPSPVTKVLEVNSGWSKKNNISVGDEVKLFKNN